MFSSSNDFGRRTSSNHKTDIAWPCEGSELFRDLHQTPSRLNTVRFPSRVLKLRTRVAPTARILGRVSSCLVAWYWLVGPTNSSINPVYFFQYQSGGTVQGQYPIIDVKPGDHGYTHFWELYNSAVKPRRVAQLHWRD